MATIGYHLRTAGLITALLAVSWLSSAKADPAALETAALAQALQVLVVTSADWDAPRGSAQRFERSATNVPFRPLGKALPVWLGRAGLGWRSDAQAAPPPGSQVAAPRKREGDGRSPAGLLTLGEMWGYAAQAPSGVTMPYHAASARDRCVDDAGSPYYNQLATQPLDRPAPWQSAEALRLPTDHYKYLVVMDYNTKTPRPAAGSCIFLHVAPPPGAATAGCTALAEADLLTVLRWLDAARQPVILQLPRPVLAAAWHLPRELVRR